MNIYIYMLVRAAHWYVYMMVCVTGSLPLSECCATQCTYMPYMYTYTYVCIHSYIHVYIFMLVFGARGCLCILSCGTCSLPLSECCAILCNMMHVPKWYICIHMYMCIYIHIYIYIYFCWHVGHVHVHVWWCVGHAACLSHSVVHPNVPDNQCAAVHCRVWRHGVMCCSVFQRVPASSKLDLRCVCAVSLAPHICVCCVLSTHTSSPLVLCCASCTTQCNVPVAPQVCAVPIARRARVCCAAPFAPLNVLCF